MPVHETITEYQPQVLPLLSPINGYQPHVLPSLTMISCETERKLSGAAPRNGVENKLGIT